MDYLSVIFIAVCAILVAMSIFSVIYGIVRGKGISHKILVCVASLWGVVFLICFGGNAVLSIFDMGWRCTPFNAMLSFCSVLFIPLLLCSLWQLFHLEDPNPALALFGTGSMFLAILITLVWALFYFYVGVSNWHDGLRPYNDQTIVVATDSHGGSGGWRYYIHINDLVHGAEITQDVWYGPQPWNLPRSFLEVDS